MCHVEDPKTAEKCEYGAAMTIDGIKCYCPANKFLNQEGKCEFINHCDKVNIGKSTTLNNQNDSLFPGLTPVCSQQCTDNKNGSFTCSCLDPRLFLVNGTHCVESKEGWLLDLITN